MIRPPSGLVPRNPTCGSVWPSSVRPCFATHLTTMRVCLSHAVVQCRLGPRSPAFHPRICLPEGWQRPARSWKPEPRGVIVFLVHPQPPGGTYSSVLHAGMPPGHKCRDAATCHPQPTRRRRGGSISLSLSLSQRSLRRSSQTRSPLMHPRGVRTVGFERGAKSTVLFLCHHHPREMGRKRVQRYPHSDRISGVDGLGFGPGGLLHSALLAHGAADLLHLHARFHLLHSLPCVVALPIEILTSYVSWAGGGKESFLVIAVVGPFSLISFPTSFLSDSPPSQVSGNPCLSQSVGWRAGP